MEKFRIIKVDIVLLISVAASLIASLLVDNVDGYALDGAPWLITEKPVNLGLRCSDILQMTRKLLENDLLRNVIYHPKLTVAYDPIYGKSTKIVETRAQPNRNVVHFPSKPYHSMITSGSNDDHLDNQLALEHPDDQKHRPQQQQQQSSSSNSNNNNRSENSRFKRHHRHQPYHQSPPKLYQQHFTKIGSLSSQTINLVPISVPFDDASSIDVNTVNHNIINENNNNRQPQTYLFDLSSLTSDQSSSISPPIDQVDYRSVRPRYFTTNQNHHLERRQDNGDNIGQDQEDQETEGADGESEGESKEPNVVKKTFGYKVTLYKSPNVQEPQILTEEFFGDGKQKKVIKILKKDETKPRELGGSGTTKQEQLTQQSSSSSGRYTPQYGVSPLMVVDQSDEDELDSNRKLLGSIRKQLADEKGIEASRTISKSGDESQHDKRGAKEKALREKTQIEFFEREKIFANEDKYGEKLTGQLPQSQQPQQPVQQQPQQYQIMKDRPAIVRLTTVAPTVYHQVDRQPITIVTTEDENSNNNANNVNFHNNNNNNNDGMDFQSLHDLLLKRLKGWREKGYKITTELEIVQRGAVHDKARSVRQRGKGEQTFQRYERGGKLRGKAPSPYIGGGGSLNDQTLGQIEPLTVTHVSPDNSNSNNNNNNINNDKSHSLEISKELISEKENQLQNQNKKLFSSLPKFLLDPGDYEAELDGPDGKVDPNELLPPHQRQPLHQLQPLTPHLHSALPHPQPHPHHHPHHYPQNHHPNPHHHAHHNLHPISPLLHHHHHHHEIPHSHHGVIVPPQPEALKLQAAPPPSTTSTKTVKQAPKNATTIPTKGQKYSFKGMTRKIPVNDEEKSTNKKVKKAQQHSHIRDENSEQINNSKNSDKFKVSTTPVSTLSDVNNSEGRAKIDKQKNGQSSRRLAAQRKLKARAKQKAKLKQQKLAQKQQQQRQNQPKQSARNIFRSPMSIQDKIAYPASPLSINNSGRENEITYPSGLGVDINNPLSFLDGIHSGLYMPNENGFDDISFGNPTLITLPGLIDPPNGGDNNHQITEQFQLFSNAGGGGGPSNGLKQNFLGYPDYIEIGKKQRLNGISFEEPLTSINPSPPQSPPQSPPHTEILIGKTAVPKKLSSSSTDSSGHEKSKTGKVRDYPTSIQDITRGVNRKMNDNNDPVEPFFGRESPDNVLLYPKPGKDLESSQFKDSGFKQNDLNSWINGHGLTKPNHKNNNDNSRATPLALSWLQHEAEPLNLLKNSPGRLSVRDQGKQGQSPNSILGLNNFNHQVGQSLTLTEGGGRGGHEPSTRYITTQKPKQKKGFVFNEPLELINDQLTKELKPVDYPRSTWAEPETDRVRGAKPKQAQNKSKEPKKGKRRKVNTRYQQQLQKITDEMISIGFDSQRMSSPKSQDLLSRSSQIYPLIGGYSPFIIPSTADDALNDDLGGDATEIDNEGDVEDTNTGADAGAATDDADDVDDGTDDEQMTAQDSSGKAQLEINNIGDDGVKPKEADKSEKLNEEALKSNSNTSNNGDDGHNDNVDLNGDSHGGSKSQPAISDSQQHQPKQNITNNLTLLPIKSKINDNNEANIDEKREEKSNYDNSTKRNQTDLNPINNVKDVAENHRESPQIWSQPCSNCPEL